MHKRSERTTTKWERVHRALEINEMANSLAKQPLLGSGDERKMISRLLFRHQPTAEMKSFIFKFVRRQWRSKRHSSRLMKEPICQVLKNAVAEVESRKFQSIKGIATVHTNEMPPKKRSQKPEKYSRPGKQGGLNGSFLSCGENFFCNYYSFLSMALFISDVRENISFAFACQLLI